MEGIEIKEIESLKPKKKKVEKVGKDDARVTFMKHMNQKRKDAGIDVPAYSEEEINAYK